MRLGRFVLLAFVLAWFYLLIAVIVNPAFTPPSSLTNPVMPFLSPGTINLLWPVVLLLSPLLLVSVQRLTQSFGGSRRQVSPEEFARIQARAHATSQSIREGVRSQELSSTPRTGAQVGTPPKSRETVERPFPRLDIPESSQQGAKEESGKMEFTPPPKSLREAVFGNPSANINAGEGSVAEPTGKEAEGEVTELDKGIEELEAEKGAVSSLATRLEEMKSSGTIDQGLYEKLKKKYGSEIDRINSRIEKLARKERKKPSNK